MLDAHTENGLVAISQLGIGFLSEGVPPRRPKGPFVEEWQFIVDYHKTTVLFVDEKFIDEWALGFCVNEIVPSLRRVS